MPLFYGIDSTRVTLREYWWGSKSPLVLLIGILLKLFRVQIPSSSDDALVDSTSSFVVESLPPEVMAGFGPLAAELAVLGFGDPVYHIIEDHSTLTRWYWATFRHNSGQHCARIHQRFWGRASKPDRGIFPLFITAFVDGTFLVSSSGKPDVAAPQTVQMNRMPKAKVASLWAAHERLVGAALAQRAIQVVGSRAEVAAATERLHVLQRDFHLARGFFRVPTAEEQNQANTFSTQVTEARASGLENPEALIELTRLQEAKPKWTSAIWILVGSLVAFLGAGSAQWDWKLTLGLVPILLFHETGHWVAMRIFGYRNLRMFFIPFFGAAVTGQNWNVPGWKKALVSLAGPLPGIALGVILGIAGLIWKAAWLKQAALMLILINGFNLLPVLPLDGGHFLHATLFCRNRWLDITFRGAAVAGLLLMSAGGFGRPMMYIGIVLAVSLPVAFKMAKVTDRLRTAPLPPPLPGEDRIPSATAQVLVASVKEELPKNTNNKVIAQHALNVFETLNARPPNIWATLGLLALYGTSLLVALSCAALLVVNKNTNLAEFFRAAVRQPTHKIACNAYQTRAGSAAASPASVQDLVITTFKDRQTALNAFNKLDGRVPPTATATLFGDSLLLSLPADDETAREHWFDELQKQSTNTFVVVSNNVASIGLMFLAADLGAATNLELELKNYLHLSEMNLIPPWDPKAATREFDGFRKGRAVWSELDSQVGSVWQSEAMKGYPAKIAAARRRGAAREADRLSKEQMELSAQMQAQAREKLKAKYASTPFADLVDLNTQLSALNYTNRTERKEILSRAAVHLGVSDQPKELGIGASGFVSRHGLMLEVSWLSVRQPARGLPAILDWLCKHNAGSIKYEMHTYSSVFEGLDDDEQ